MRTTSLAVAAAFAMFCAPAAAVAQEEPAAAEQAGAEAEVEVVAEADAVAGETPEQTAYLDQRVCRAAPRAASRLASRERICMTRREWRVQEELAQQDTRDAIRGAGTQTSR